MISTVGCLVRRDGRGDDKQRYVDVRTVPATNGIQNQVRVLNSRKVWMPNRATKMKINIAAAAMEGVYSYLESAAILGRSGRFM